MDARQRTRSCVRTPAEAGLTRPRGSKQICVPMTRELYDQLWDDPKKLRPFLERLVADLPELFPAGIEHGFTLTGKLPASVKQGVSLRQLRLRDQRVFTLRPSFVFGYMTGTVDELEKPLLLLSVGTPCWVVTKVCGRNDMFWQRLLERLGRNSLVGTTVRDPARMPLHLAADEHHADWCGEKGYVAMTAGGGCVLGLALTEAADDQHLAAAYKVFQQEALDAAPEYVPLTVNTDGWNSTRNAFRTLYPAILLVLCFLHGFLKIRDRCRKAHDLHQQVWYVYHAETRDEFTSRMTAFGMWFESHPWPQAVTDMVTKLRNRTDDYALGYTHPGCHRTSNQVDRPMNRLHRSLYASRGLHGHQASGERRLRGLVLLHNFRPFAPRSNQPRTHDSPAHRLNQKQYHTHWLHNLQASASLAGYKTHT